MNLAKWLMFCRDFQIIRTQQNPQGVKKDLLTKMFKKVVPNTRDCEYEHFRTLIDKCGVRFFS